ncbi:unnamed protein product [Tuwongella immobilis]|uniref:Uncharacterized protein n=1 Tax=Tuwongella immobilis TaxID=692036 RepID=A0A6C2YSI2_9BACT|nr:unnamed protein product [Tuwongella immobilis]VTS05990.1 unnamed protein product [Tuwongella immobilis]
MSAKRSKPVRSFVSKIVRKTRKAIRTMSDEKKIDIMVEAGIFTPEEAERAKQASARASSSANPST